MSVVEASTTVGEQDRDALPALVRMIASEVRDELRKFREEWQPAIAELRATIRDLKDAQADDRRRIADLERDHEETRKRVAALEAARKPTRKARR